MGIGAILALVATVVPLPPVVAVVITIAGAGVVFAAPLVANYVEARLSANSATRASATPTVQVASSNQKALRRTAQ